MLTTSAGAKRRESAYCAYNCYPSLSPTSVRFLSITRYTLQLSAKPPSSSSSLRFEAALGATQSEAFVMKVFNASSGAEPVEFECSLEGGQETHFRVPPKVLTR